MLNSRYRNSEHICLRVHAIDRHCCVFLALCGKPAMTVSFRLLANLRLLSAMIRSRALPSQIRERFRLTLAGYDSSYLPPLQRELPGQGTRVPHFWNIIHLLAHQNAVSDTQTTRVGYCGLWHCVISVPGIQCNGTARGHENTTRGDVVATAGSASAPQDTSPLAGFILSEIC